MCVSNAARPEHPLCALDRVSHFLGSLDVIDLDIDHSEPDPDTRIHFAQGLEVGRRAMRELEDQMIRPQAVEKRDECRPGTALDRLAAIVAEADVHRFTTDGGEDLD